METLNNFIDQFESIVYEKLSLLSKTFEEINSKIEYHLGRPKYCNFNYRFYDRSKFKIESISKDEIKYYIKNEEIGHFKKIHSISTEFLKIEDVKKYVYKNIKKQIYNISEEYSNLIKESEQNRDHYADTLYKIKKDLRKIDNLTKNLNNENSF